MNISLGHVIILKTGVCITYNIVLGVFGWLMFKLWWVVYTLQVM